MADELDWNHLTKLIRKHLGKSLNTNYSNFLWDIILISNGLKPSLLFDYTCAEPEKLGRVIEDLQKSGAIPNSLSVVVIGQDVFITDVKSLLILLKDNLRNKSFSLIDVSGKLENPAFVDERIETQLCEHFTDLILQLEKHARATFLLRCDVEVKDDWNLSTMFGFLLCYPVIYWFETTTDYNCLPLVPLALYKAILPLSTLNNSNFTLPFISLVKRVPAHTKEKAFFAFSCPESLLTVDVVKCIDKWAAKLRKISETVCESLAIKIDKSTVIQKQVTL